MYSLQGGEEMGLKKDSGFFKNTNGEKKMIPMNIQLFAEFPKNKSQINHIMSDRNGHLPDTIDNRSLLVSVSMDKNNYLGKDEHGNEWYAKMINGKQVWVTVKNDVIQNGGVNDEPLKYIKNNGLKKNVVRRKKK